jgi:N-acetylmuramic acid 6-phosphate etherase
MADDNGKTGWVLGVEGGGTRCTWSLLDSRHRVVKTGTAGPANYKIIGPNGLARLLKAIRTELPHSPDIVGCCLAGCHLPSEKQAVESILRKTWPQATRVVAGEDTKSGFYAAHGNREGIMVIAGTGSNVMAHKQGRWEKAGGWGHLFSDPGSAYHTAQAALRTCYDDYDRNGRTTPLAQAFLAHTASNTMAEMISWIYAVPGKEHLASLCQVVVQCAETGDRQARTLLRDGAGLLAEKTILLARRMNMARPRIGLVGGMFQHSTVFLRAYQRAVRKSLPAAQIFLVTTPGSVGAALFALDSAPLTPAAPLPSRSGMPIDLDRLPTEQRNPRSHGLHRKSVATLVDLFIDEEKRTRAALHACRGSITRACDATARTLARGGRLFYVGAGTSGRLGILDASEMPPTFGVPPDLVQGIIAGGTAAVFRAQEGAEDDAALGARSVRERGITRRDIVWGIAASGRTPFVLGALEEARRLGAATVLLTCNPDWSHPTCKPGIGIHLPTGPELVTGSTRLKAGTATKLVLNMASTIAMIRTGRVLDNLMVNVQATNDKLRARCLRLVRILTGAGPEPALAALEKHRWNVTRAAAALRRRQ